AIMLLTFFIYPLKRVKDKMIANWLNSDTFSIRIVNNIRETTYFLRSSDLVFRSTSDKYSTLCLITGICIKFWNSLLYPNTSNNLEYASEWRNSHSANVLPKPLNFGFGKW